MVKQRGYSPKKRNSGRRKIGRVLLVSAEGNTNNKTEKLYLNHFNGENIKVRFVSGNETDPEKMMQRLVTAYNYFELDSQDLAVCLIDSDFEVDRDKTIKKVDDMVRAAQKENLCLIVSSPSFELWYICHFRYSTRQYQNNQDVLNELRRFIPNYEKSKDVYSCLQGKEDEAVKNAQKLEKWCSDNGKCFHCVECMPSTEMYKVLQWIREVH